MDNIHFLFGLVIGALVQTGILYVGYCVFTQCQKNATIQQREESDSYDSADWWKQRRKNDLN